MREPGSRNVRSVHTRVMNRQALEHACERLRTNPITHLGLVNKELFHSNFLAWLVEAHPEIGRRLFRHALTVDAQQMEQPPLREWRHLDLVLRLGGHRPLVIENKTFAPPDARQLDLYAEDLEVRRLRADHLLLSLTPPEWVRSVMSVAPTSVWNYMSYNDLVESLGELDDLIPDAFERELVDRYSAMLRDLISIVAVYGELDEDDRVVPGSDELALLRRTRIVDGILKLRVRMIAQRVARDAKEALGEVLAGVDSGFTNGSPFLSMSARHGDVNLGWQLQRGQFRLTAKFLEPGLRGPKDPTRRSIRAAELKADQVWFDFAPVADLVSERATRPLRARPDDRGFNHYAPDFVYEYRTISDLTIGELLELNRRYAAIAMARAAK